MTDELEGAKCETWPEGWERARFAAELARAGKVAYRALGSREPPASAASPSEQRTSARNRTRLRSAKILDAANAFVCECRVHDASRDGMRLALARNVGLPARFLVHDDDTGVLRMARLAWRRGAEIGVRFDATGPPRPLRPSQRFALRQRYYAVSDRAPGRSP